MANIDSYIGQIRRAIYGEEVRESIASALQANSVEAQQALDTAETAIEKLSKKLDGAYLENGYLWLTSNGEAVVGPLGPFAGNGGGSADPISRTVKYYNHDGTSLLRTETVVDGADAAYNGTPSRPSTAQYTYAFAGWSKEPNGAVWAQAQKTITSDRVLYAAYTATLRRYTVYFYNGTTLLQTVPDVPYGGSASYTAGATSSITNSQGQPFTCWDPLPVNIQGDTNCYAQFAGNGGGSADPISRTVKYYNHDGTSLLRTETVVDGADAAYNGTPSRPSTAQYTYAFAGWSKEPNGAVWAQAQKTITSDRVLYAAYTATLRRYTVYFYNGTTLLQTVPDVPYGGSASYTAGATSSITNGQGKPFTGWDPLPVNIQGDTNCYAQFAPMYDSGETITDSWAEIAAHVSAGDYATRYSVGDIKVLDLGVEGKVGMQIIAFDKDTKPDGAKAAITWLSKELLKTSRRWNPSLTSGTSEVKYAGVNKFVPAGGGYKNTNQGRGGTKSQGLWRITASADTVLTVSWTTDCESTYDKLSIYFGKSLKGTFSGEGRSGTLTENIAAGASLIVMAEYAKDGSGDKGSDTATVSFAGDSLTVEQIDTETIVVEGKPAAAGTGTIGGWENSELRTYYRETLMPLIPAAVRASIVPVTKTHPAYRSKSADLSTTELYTQVTTDKVWCPSYAEMLSSEAASYTSFFTSNAARKKFKVGASSASWWWLRSAYNDGSAYNVYGGGNSNYSNVYSRGGLALGFCF